MALSSENKNMPDVYTPAELSTKWVENLALEEINMDTSGVIHVEDHLNPLHLLEESSIEFMNTLRDRFEFYVGKFNEFRGTKTGGMEIKIFKISATVNDFILFRSGVRLVVARKANDLISVGFVSGGKNFFGARTEQNDPIGENPIDQIKAHVGPFNRISWRFADEEVAVEPMVKHYLSEFIRISVR